MMSITVGFFGKLPSHGDFVRRRVSEAFVDVWDTWAQECLEASRITLGDRWLDVYLTSPVWRFLGAAGAAGPLPVMGLMAPSVDRVGRYFPLTVVAELPDAVEPVSTATRAAAFFEAAEQLVIDILAAETVDFDGFDRAVAQLGHELEPAVTMTAAVLGREAVEVLRVDQSSQWQVPLGSPPDLGDLLRQILTQQLHESYEPLALWWTDGSGIVEPSCLISKGLLHPDTFAALLDGSWTGHRWQSVSTPSSDEHPTGDTLVGGLAPLQFRSAAVSNVGKVRAVNQDAYLERSEIGLWVVADGLGGHSHGEIASRMVCDALADFAPRATFEAMIQGARQRLSRVNERLVQASEQLGNGESSGSTVVALLARGAKCAILWAGDSRVYRFREGLLDQLTTDHSVAGSQSELAEGHSSNAVTRAVGGERVLALELRRDRVQARDRYLLCTDGLTRFVPEQVIAQGMEEASVECAVDQLIQAALAAGAPDNVTALVVEASE
jgi:type VI secretion system protein ImpM